MKQKHTICREASLAVRLDVFIDLAKIQEALKTPFGKNTLIKSFNSANCPCETNRVENRHCTWLPKKTPPSSSCRMALRPPTHHYNGSSQEAAQDFKSLTLQTKNLPGITTRQRDRLFF